MERKTDPNILDKKEITMLGMHFIAYLKNIAVRSRMDGTKVSIVKAFIKRK